MTMFGRGLHDKAWAALTAMAEAGASNWWQDLLTLWAPSGTAAADRPLRLALRHNYLNLYAQGQSIAKVTTDRGGRPYATLHARQQSLRASRPRWRLASDSGAALTL